MQIIFDFEFIDLINTHKKIIGSSNIHKKRMLIFYVIFILFTITTLFDSKIVLFKIIFLILWIVFFPGLYKYLALIGVKRMIRKQNNTALFGQHVIEINNEGVQRITEFIKTSLAWDQFVNYQEDNLYYFLFISDFQSITIPKRAFNMESDRQFKLFLNKYLLKK